MLSFIHFVSLNGIKHLTLCLLVSVAAGVTLSSCTTLSDRAKHAEDAAEFESRDPEKDARERFANKDYRVITAMGVGRYYPGLDHEAGARIESLHSSHHMGGTSDFSRTKAESRFNRSAASYAGRYNQTLHQLLKNSGKLEGQSEDFTPLPFPRERFSLQ